MKKIDRQLLATIAKEWKWIFGYIKRYRLTILLYILFGIVAVCMSAGSAVSSKFLVDAVMNRDRTVLFRSAVAVISLSVAQVLFQAMSSRVTAVISTRVGNELRNEIYGRVISARWEQIGVYHSGELLNRIEGDVSAVASGVIHFIPSVFSKSLLFILLLCVVLYYDAVMAVLALLSSPFFALSSRFLVRSIRKYNNEVRNVNGEVLSFSQESLRNVQIIKSFDLVSQYIKRFCAVTEKYRTVKLRYEKFSILMTMVFSLLGIVVGYACYGWGAYRLWQGAITVGTMTLFLQISGALNSTFSSLASLAPGAVSIATSAGRIMELTRLDTENDADREKALRLLAAADGGFRLRAEDLTFSYADSDKNVLEHVDFTFRPGERIAVIGESGNAKTTLLRLFLGLLRPVGGKIVFEAGGEELSISDSTRRFFSYVPQEDHLFSGTIADNLRAVAPEAKEEDLMRVLRIACMDRFISEEPEGLERRIGENGDNLSQGQLQRISIARALLRDAPVMLLDEATSALDADTERRVLEGVLRQDDDRLFIITTHRKSVLDYCTAVCRIGSDGRLVFERPAAAADGENGGSDETEGMGGASAIHAK